MGITNVGKVIYKSVTGIANTLFLIVVAFIWISACVSTSVVGLDATEHVSIVRDSAIVNLLVLFAFVIILLFVYHKIPYIKLVISRVNSNDRSYQFIKLVLCCFTSLFAFAMILAFRIVPDSDQADIIGSAARIIAGEYEVFDKGGYLDTNPHQTGMVLLFIPLEIVAGEHAAMLFQIFNGIALAFIYKSFADISDILGESHFTGIMIMAFSAVFTPALIYSTFVYGILLGLCFAVLTTKNIMRYYKCSENRYLLFAAFFSFLAVIFKSNYMIFLLGNILLAIILVFKKIKDENFSWQFVFIIPVLLFVLVTNKTVINGVAYGITGHQVNRGISNFAYIAMGLQENDNLYDGWWNYYNEATYIDADYDTDRQEEVVFEYLQDRLTEFASDRWMALDFFIRKNVSQWNEPDLQSIWLLTSKHKNGISVSAWFAKGLFWILNYQHFLIVAGVLLYLVLCKNKNDAYTCFAIIILGGFVFHTFWEGKAQYTVPYFILFLPIAVSGYKELISKCRLI